METLNSTVELQEFELNSEAIFTYEISDIELENSAGDIGMDGCSCTPCKSNCSQDSR